MGMVAGVGIATAGGVTAYSFMGSKPAEQGSAVAIEAPADEANAQAAAAAPAVPAPAQAAPAPVARPAATPAPAPRPAATAAAAPAPVEECWDEEVTVQADPKDQNKIAGTAIGAVVGGAIGKDVG